MARIDDSKKLFFITSPRTPFKMIPEIELLINNLSGKPWDKRSQNDFANLLADSLSFKGNASNDKGMLLEFNGYKMPYSYPEILFSKVKLTSSVKTLIRKIERRNHE